jgi:hypothetical protein
MTAVPADRAAASRDDKSLPTLASELLDLVRAYAKQETVEPIKGLGRFAAFGTAGSVLLGVGVVLLVLAGLRALQTETGDVFDGNWSWAPYVITFVGASLVILLALSRIRRRSTT